MGAGSGAVSDGAPPSFGRRRSSGLPPLIPSVKTSTWRCHDPDKEAADADYGRVRISVIRAAAYTCEYCGFRSQVPPQPPARARSRPSPTSLQASGFLQVHHLDDDHGNNDPSNLACVCPYCHQVFHCGNGGHQGNLHVIWFPWMSQADLNLLTHVLFAAIDMDSRYAREAERLYFLLQSYTGRMVEEFGFGMEDPVRLGTALMGLYRSDRGLYARRSEVLAPVRLLPDIDSFRGERRYWSDVVWRSMPDDTWEGILKTWLSKTKLGRPGIDRDTDA